MSTTGYRKCLNCGDLFKPRAGTKYFYCDKPECEEVKRKSYQKRYRKKHNIGRDNTITCSSCGKVCEYTPTKAGPKPKYFYCDDPKCQYTAIAEGKKRDREAQRRSYKRRENGRLVIPRETEESNHTCSKCGGRIFYWKEYGKWVKPRMLCKDCLDNLKNCSDNYEYDKRLQPRMDGDFLYA